MLSPGDLRARRHAAFALLPVLQWAVSFGVGSTLRNVWTYDGAWYYAVARNVAMGRGLLDTVLWQFLAPPATVAQPAGSYWEIGWPAFLGTIMRVVGASERSAIHITCALSGLLPVATAALAWLATERVSIAWLAGLLVIVQSYLLPTVMVPDVTLAYQLTCLGALVAFHLANERAPAVGSSPRRRRVRLFALGAALSLPSLVRGEGALVLLATAPLFLGSGSRVRALGWRGVVTVAAGAFAPQAVLLARNLVVLGRAVPASRALRNWLTSYNQLYAFGSPPNAEAFWAQPRAQLLAVRTNAIETHLHQLTTVVSWPLLAFAAVGVVVHLWRRRGRAVVLPIFAILTLLVPCLGAPLLAAQSRFVRNELPVLGVLAAIGVTAITDLLRARVSAAFNASAEAKGRWSRVIQIAMVAPAAWACAVFFREPGRTFRTEYDRLGNYRDVPRTVTLGRTLELRPDDVVMTDDPWRLAADLDVATLMCPMNGPAAVEAAALAYRPRFVVTTSASRGLSQLAASGKLPMREVARGGGVVWYELQASRNARGL